MPHRLVYLLCCCLLTTVAIAADCPNVVIVLTDDQGALDAGCYGSNDLKTPNMDRLAAEGVRFTNAYAHTVCCPARAMLVTGRHPQRSDIGSWAQGETTRKPTGRNLLHSETTIAEAFRDAGYATAIYGKWHLGAAETHGPMKQGFDEFFGIRGGFIDNYNHHSLHGVGKHDLYNGVERMRRPGEYFMDLVTDRAESFIRRNHNRPFLLYYAMNLPHYPEQSIEPYASDFADLDSPRQSYARIVATTDHYIGRLLKLLDEFELSDNTVFLFTSDNGYSAEDYQISVHDHSSGLPKGTNYGANAGGGNTGKWRGAKGSFLEGGLRVPAILRYPAAIEPGTVRDQTVTLMDWFPTIAGYCGVDVSGIQFDGFDVRPAIENDSPDHYDVMHWAWQNGWAVRRGDWKLVRNGSLGLSGHGKNAKSMSMPKTFLGNLSGDSPEAVNHAADHTEIVAELEKLHEDWAAEVEP